MEGLRVVGRGIAMLGGFLLFVLIIVIGLALFLGFWFGLNWTLERLGIPIRILPRL
jgi:hypothetical protein